MTAQPSSTEATPLKVKIEDLSPILKQVEVEVSATEVDHAIDAAYRNIGKRAQIKGFRRGKVPRRVLERYYAHDVAHEVAEQLVRETWPKTVLQEKLEPVATPQVEDEGHVTAGAAWTYKAKVEVLPPLKVTDYKTLKGETYSAAVKDEEIDAEVTRLQEAMAQMVPEESREVVESGDYVAADIAATLDGKAFAPGSGKDIVFEVSEGEVTRGHLPEAAEHKVGETLELERSFGEEESNEALRGKTLQFEVKLLQIRKREIPAADDELAKDLGEEGIETMMALRGDIRRRLLEQKQGAADKRLKDSLIKDLVDRNPMDVPLSLVNRTAEGMVRPFIQSLMQSGMDPKVIGESLDLEALLNEARPSAELAVKGSLLLRAVAEVESLELGEGAVEAHFEKLATESKQNADKVRAVFEKDPDEMSALRRRLLEDVALDFLREKATITEVEPKDPDASIESDASSATDAAAES